MNFSSGTGMPDGKFAYQKNLNLGIFGALEWKKLLYFTTTFLHTYYGHLAYFKAIWYILRSFFYIFPRFGMLYQEKSGSPGQTLKHDLLRKMCVRYDEIHRLAHQGCQIFLSTTYQNWKNIQNNHTKYQMATK
jgi:hypothetical protein